MTTIGLELTVGEHTLRIGVEASSFEEAEARVRAFHAVAEDTDADALDIEIVEVKHR